MDQIVNWEKVEWVILDMDGTGPDLAYDNYFWRQLVPQRYAVLRGLTLEQARIEPDPTFLEIQHTPPGYCTESWSQLNGHKMAAHKREP